MAKISIDPAQTRAATSSLSGKVVLIESVATAANLAHSLASPLAYLIAGLDGTLSSAQASIRAIQSDCDKLVRTVNDCCALYEQTEEAVYRTFGGDKNLFPHRATQGIAGTVATDYVNKPPVDGALLSTLITGTTAGSAVSFFSFLFGGKTDASSSAKFDSQTGKFTATAKAKAEGSLAGATVKGSTGMASGEAGFNVGKATVKGEAFALYDPESGELRAGASAGGSISGIEANAKGQIGSDETNLHADAKGTLGYAEAKAEASIGTDGITAKGSAEVCAVKGEAHAGFSLFGIDVDFGVTGKAGALGVEGELQMNSSGVKFGGGASALFGFGFDVKIDWSHAKLPSFSDIAKWIF